MRQRSIQREQSRSPFQCRRGNGGARQLVSRIQHKTAERGIPIRDRVRSGLQQSVQFPQGTPHQQGTRGACQRPEGTPAEAVSDRIAQARKAEHRQALPCLGRQTGQNAAFCRVQHLFRHKQIDLSLSEDRSARMRSITVRVLPLPGPPNSRFSMKYPSVSVQFCCTAAPVQGEVSFKRARPRHAKRSRKHSSDIPASASGVGAQQTLRTESKRRVMRSGKRRTVERTDQLAVVTAPDQRMPPQSILLFESRAPFFCVRADRHSCTGCPSASVTGQARRQAPHPGQAGGSVGKCPVRVP